MGKLLRYVGWAMALALVLLAGQARQLRLRTARTEALFQAIRAEQPEIVAALLEQGTPPDAKDDFGAPAICRAAECADPALAVVLLRAGAAVDQRDADGATPLMEAAGCGHLEVAHQLLAAGADVNAANRQGWTALHVAANDDRPEMVAFLVRAGAHLAPRRADGATPLMLTLKHGFQASARELLHAGAVVRPQDHRAVSRLLSLNTPQPFTAQGLARAHPPRFSTREQEFAPRQGERPVGRPDAKPNRITHVHSPARSSVKPNKLAFE